VVAGIGGGVPGSLRAAAGGGAAWLTLIAVPLALTDIAVHPGLAGGRRLRRRPRLLTVAALTGRQPGRLARAATALACFYFALCLLRPGEMGLGDAKLAASIGLVLGWASWQALVIGTFAGFAVAAVYGGVRLAAHRATRTTKLPLGPFILLGALAAVALLRCRFQTLMPLSRCHVDVIATGSFSGDGGQFTGRTFAQQRANSELLGAMTLKPQTGQRSRTTPSGAGHATPQENRSTPRSRSR
jgi:leader peptidase (prepilin peptidase)/N-methyltransferase